MEQGRFYPGVSLQKPAYTENSFVFSSRFSAGLPAAEEKLNVLSMKHSIKRAMIVDKPEWFWYNFYTVRLDDFCGWDRNFRQELLLTETAVLADKKRTLECVMEVTYEKNYGMDSDLGVFRSGDELLRSVYLAE